MKHNGSMNDTLPPAGGRPDEIAVASTGTRGPYSGRSSALTTRSTPAAMMLALSMAALVSSGCANFGGADTSSNAVVEEPVEMDTILVSDFLRFYLDGEREMDRARADCYDGVCFQTDGDRSLINLPEFFVFAGHHDELISAREETVEDRNGILIGDVSLGKKDLPDIPGVAIERTITGYGGWGSFVGFDALYYDYERHNRPQRIVEATLGGYASEGNPHGENLTWTGGAVGIDHSVIDEDRVLVGNAELNVLLHARLDELVVDVDITDMTDVATGTVYDDMAWEGLLLREGGFETFEIRGRFFGPDHEEVGGVFERDQVSGAFGATREE